MENNDLRTTHRANPDEASTEGGHPVNPQGAVPAPLPSPGESPPAAHRNAENPEGHQTNGQPTPGSENQKRIESSAIWMIVLTGIIAVATGLNVWIFYLESESTSTQIDKLTKKAGGIVDTMNTALSENRDAVSKAFDANKDALKASTEQSGKALNASIEASRNDQRAWVGVTTVIEAQHSVPGNPFKVFLKENEPSHLGVQIKNNGKTPAFAVMSIINVRALLKDTPFSPIYFDPKTPESSAVLQPGMDVKAFTPPSGTPPPVEIIKAVKEGRSKFYLFGKISYGDAFGRQHHTTFCLELDNTLTSFSACNTYNTAD